MIIVSDTSPLNYLVLIGNVEVLPQLFGQIIIPQAVFDKLSHTKTPAPIKIMPV